MGSAVDTLLHDAPDFTVNWIQVETIQWPLALATGLEHEVRRGVYLMLYCMP